MLDIEFLLVTLPIGLMLWVGMFFCAYVLFQAIKESR